MNVLDEKRVFSLIFDKFTISISYSINNADTGEIEVTCGDERYRDTVDMSDIKEIVKRMGC